MLQPQNSEEYLVFAFPLSVPRNSGVAGIPCHNGYHFTTTVLSFLELVIQVQCRCATSCSV